MIALHDVIKFLLRPIRIVNFITWLIVNQKMNYILIKTTLIIMCPSQSLKLKSSWHFVKWITLNNVLMTHHIHNVLRFFTISQPPFYIYSLKRGTKWFWVQRIQFKWFFMNFKIIIMFLTWSLYFHFFNGLIHNVVST